MLSKKIEEIKQKKIEEIKQRKREEMCHVTGVSLLCQLLLLSQIQTASCISGISSLNLYVQEEEVETLLIKQIFNQFKITFFDSHFPLYGYEKRIKKVEAKPTHVHEISA